MGVKTSFILYHEFRAPLELLTDEQRGKLFLSLFDYSESGIVPTFDDGAIMITFEFIKNAIDRDAKAWEDKCEKRRIAGSMGGKARAENFKQSQANQANAKFAKQSQANQAEHDHESEHEHDHENEHEKERKRAAKPPAHPRGAFGWVRLTDAQYEKLIADLGEKETKRCIEYIDESAQQTENKNGWRDWNLVIRKCSREGWGRKTPRSDPPPPQEPDWRKSVPNRPAGAPRSAEGEPEQ